MRDLIRVVLIICALFGATMVPLALFVLNDQVIALRAYALFCFSFGTLVLGKGMLGLRSYLAEPGTSDASYERGRNIGHWIVGFIVCLTLWLFSRHWIVLESAIGGMVVGSLIWPSKNRPARIDDPGLAGGGGGLEGW